MMLTDPEVRAVLAILLSAALFGAFYALAVAVRLRGEMQREALRFKLFAARDRLYLMVASQDLDANSEEFLAFRNALNFVIRESDSAGAIEFVRMLDIKGMPLEERIEHLPALTRAEYASIVAETATAIYELFTLNSRILRLLRWLANHPEQQPVTPATQLKARAETFRQISVEAGVA